MAVFGALSIGRTGLINQSAALSVIGNNIANVSTTAFKGSRIEFADLLSASVGGSGGKVGLGSRIGNIRTLFEQGAIENTGRDRDLAIEGEGFFLVGDPESPLFTRAGNFSSDADGNIVTTQGQTLLAFPVDPVTGLASGRPDPINVGNLSSQAQPTTNMVISANLDATRAASTGFDPTSFATAFATSTHSTSLTVYDSQGGAHIGTIFFTKTGTNQWQYDVAFDAGEVTSPPPGALGAGDPIFVGDGTISFNTDGTLNAVTVGTAAAVTFTGAAAQTIALDFGTAGSANGLTQNAGTFGIRSQTQNGFGTGELLGINVTEEGFVEALFSNGESRVVSQLALARFPNNEGLTPIGNQLFRSTVESGEAIVDVPLSGGRGSIVGGALEGSNVSIAQQFIDLIEAQRSFQANTRVITSSDQLLAELMNIVR